MRLQLSLSPVFLFLVLFCCSIKLNAQRVINVQPDGINDVLVLKNAIATAKTYVGEAVTIKLGGGTYHLHRNQATALKYYISNTLDYSVSQTNIKNIGIHISGATHLTIDGEGAKLITHGEITSIVVDMSQDITLKNFSVDAADPTLTEMTVESINGNTVIYKAHTTSNFTISGTTLRWAGEYGWSFTGGPCQLYDPVRDITWRVGAPTANATTMTDLGNKRLSITYSTLPAVKVGYTYQMRDGVRDQVAGFVHKSSNVTFNAVNYYFMGNFGIVCQYSDNLNFLACKFAPEVGSGRTNAGFADFLQVSGCKGLLKVEDSYFSGAHDDPINVHGTYLKIQSYNSANQVKVKFMHGQSWGFDAFFVGDSIEFVDVASMMSIQTAKITAVTRNDDLNITLTFDQAIDVAAFQAKTSGVVVENITWTPEVEIRRNYFSRIPTRGILLTTRRRSVIEDNTFFRMQMAGVYISGDAASWYESGKVADVTIRNNKFIECGSPVIYFDPTNSVNNGYVHSNIKIDNNTFQIASGAALGGKSVDKIAFTNNTIVASGTATADSYANLSNSGVITKSGNIKLQPGTIVLTGLSVNASSSLSTNDKSLAIDGNNVSSWKPTTDDLQRWWELDLGKFYCLNRMLITFPQSGIWKYKIDVSGDKTNWTKVIDQSSNVFTVTSHSNTGNLGMNVRYVRITFSSNLAGIAEINLFGEPSLPEKNKLLNGTVIGTTGSWNNDAAATRDAVFDFNTNTYFDAPSGTAWAGLDLGDGAMVRIDSIRFAPRAGHNGRMVGGTFEISNSPSFTSSTILYTVSASPADGYTLISINNPASGRYVRYSGPANGFGNISEVEFYGTQIQTGIEDINSAKLKPSLQYLASNKMLLVHMPNTIEKNYTLTIYDVTGSVLMQQKLANELEQINCSHLNKAIVLVKLTNHFHEFSYKIAL